MNREEIIDHFRNTQVHIEHILQAQEIARDCLSYMNSFLKPGMDMAQAEKVAEAINKVTKAKYRTKLNFKFFSEAEYYDAVEAAFAWEDANNDSRIMTGKEDETGAKGYINEYGMVELVYPEIAENEEKLVSLSEKQESLESSGRAQ